LSITGTQIMNKVRLNAILGLLAVSALATALTGCSDNGSTATTATPSTLNGAYVFSVTGTDPADGDYAAVGRFVADGKGGISGGVADYNLGSGIDSLVPLTGTYTISGQTATVNLTDGKGVFDTFTVVVPSSGTAAIQNFDANGSGTLYPQVTTGFSQAGIYAATLKGEGNGATITGSGQFIVGAGNTTSGGPLSYTDGPTTMTYASVIGFVLPPASTGRGEASLAGNNLAYYVISPTQVIFIGLDERVLLTVPATKQ